MKIAMDNSPTALFELKDATKDGLIVLTRGGKPVAYVLPTKLYDEEDIGYMTNPEFWKMIRQRRKEGGPSIPLEEIEAKLAADERAEGVAKRSAKLKSDKRGKRNGSA